MCLLKFPCAKLQKRIKKYELRNKKFSLFAHITYNVSILERFRDFCRETAEELFLVEGLVEE